VSKRLLPLIPAGLVVDQVHPDAERLTILTHPRAVAAACPACGRHSARLHSRYTRTLADLPWQGRRVVVSVRSRRWRCAARDCSRRIFAERLSGIALPRGRRTERLGDLHHHLGLVLGGEAGARLAERLGIPISPDTLLRFLRRGAPAEPDRAPRVLGVDDWAWRRGQRYGTILCDLERGRVVDLLPDCESGTLAGWLRRHPGAEIVARDRAGAYADGVRRGAPDAVQVADRWHLLCNGSEALLQVLERHRGAFSRVARALVDEAAARGSAARAAAADQGGAATPPRSGQA
jgi:transposase